MGTLARPKRKGEYGDTTDRHQERSVERAYANAEIIFEDKKSIWGRSMTVTVTAIEQQEKYALLGVVICGRTNNEAKVKELKALIKEQSEQIRTLYSELGISKRHKVAERPKAKAQRKPRSDKKKPLAPPAPPEEIEGKEFDLKKG